MKKLPPVGPKAARILALLREAAEAGQPCPSNDDIAVAIDSAPSVPFLAMRRLSKRGLIAIEYRTAICRRVVFPDGLATDWTPPPARSQRRVAAPVEAMEQFQAPLWLDLRTWCKPDPRDLTGRLLNDPMPGQSALDQTGDRAA